MSTTTTAKVVDPPVFDPPIAESGQQHSQAWTEYHQQSADQINTLTTQLSALTAQIGTAKQGVTDGSDAAAGDIGEFLQATSSAVPLTSGVNAVTASLNLSPGDWQVNGNVLFTPSAGAHATQLQVASGTSSTALFYATNISATFATGVGTLLSIGYPTRFNFSAATTVYVVAGSAFTGGTMTAQGTISARRMR